MQDNMAGIWISSILLMLIGHAASEFQPSVCSLLQKSYGLIPPLLPTDFELKGELVDHVQNATEYVEIYFDYSNWRAKMKVLKRSIEYHYLFDYQTMQVVEWIVIHPGVDIKRDPESQGCTATNMDESPVNYVFGYQDFSSMRPKMYNSYEVLRYGGKYQYAFNVTEKLSERGLLSDKFIGCLYDFEHDTTMFNSYYFTNEKVMPAGGTLLDDVLYKTSAKERADPVEDTGDKYLSVPVLFQSSGINELENGSTVFFNHTTHISWFKGEPEFKMDTFQIPPWMYCDGYRGRKDMPKFPTAFSTRFLKTELHVDILGDLTDTMTESYQTIFYYGEKNLARRDFTPDPNRDTDIYSKFQSYTPVSSIYDFNQGLRYMINQPTGRCFISPIPDNDFFDTHQDLLFRKLGTPEEIFLMETDEMEYKGKAFTRDIGCDVWAGKYFNKLYNATYVKETYISTDGWHEIAEEMVEYGVPVKHMVIRKELDGDLAEGVAAFDFLKFKATTPRLVLFDIQGCIEHIDHQQYAIVLTVSDDIAETIFKYRFHFLETTQYYLSELAQMLTPLRVQRLQLLEKDNAKNGKLVFLLFTLMGKPGLRNIPLVVSITGADLDEAALNLQRVVDGNRFNIQFIPPGSEDGIVVHANAGEMYIVKGSGNLTLAPMPNSRHPPRERKKPEPSPILVQRDDSNEMEQWESRPRPIFVQRNDGNDINNVDTKPEEKKGMTSGHLALLAFAMLFIGVGIGIAVMYLYVRMNSESKVDDRIQLSFTRDKSGGEPSIASASH